MIRRLFRMLGYEPIRHRVPIPEVQIRIYVGQMLMLDCTTSSLGRRLAAMGPGYVDRNYINPRTELVTFETRIR